MNRKPGDWSCSSCDHLNFGWRDSCQRCSQPKPGDGYSGYSKPADRYSGFSKPADGYEDRADDRGVDHRRHGGSYGFGSGYKTAGSASSGYLNRGNQSDGGYGGDYRGSSDYNSRSYGGGFSGYGGSRGGSDVRPGDWHCQEGGCGAHNFASRSSCFKCGTAKDEGAVNGNSGTVDYGRGGGYDSGDREGSRGGFGNSFDSREAGSAGRAGWKSGDWICGRSGCKEHNFASRTECFRCKTPKEA